jgi:leucyl aminopeptidase (aminopeptidase T)
MFAETAELVKNASKPFELNAEPGDDVVIVTDSEIEESVWAALYAAANERDLDPTVALIPPRAEHGNDPTEAAAEAMLNADLCVMVTSTAITHSEAGAAAQHAGVKCIAMDEMTPEILRSGAAGADYEAMQGIAQALGEIYAEGSEMRITSEHGTDVVGDIEDQTYWPIAGKIVDNETQSICAFPDGEVGVAPDEGSTQGTVVWDTTVHGIGLLDEPIELTVEDGWVTEIEGGREADEYRETLEAADENAWYCAAEFSVGINPDAEVSGRMRTDKKVAGAVHIATGANKDLGGEIQSDLHIDGTIRYPDVWVDDRKIVEGGDILVDPA